MWCLQKGCETMIEITYLRAKRICYFRDTETGSTSTVENIRNVRIENHNFYFVSDTFDFWNYPTNFDEFYFYDC